MFALGLGRPAYARLRSVEVAERTKASSCTAPGSQGGGLGLVVATGQPPGTATKPPVFKACGEGGPWALELYGGIIRIF